MVICVPITSDGLIAPGWGRAERVAVAEASPDGVESWTAHQVGWGAAHDVAPEGQHHARVARFLQEHQVDAVVAEHMGEPMKNMLAKMGIQVTLGASGPAADAVSRAARSMGRTS